MHLLNIYYVIGAVLRTSHVASHLILAPSLPRGEVIVLVQKGQNVQQL